VEERPSYYAVIPASVRYADIPANAKLLYGEITALCSKEGFCWASDSYFAELYGAKRETCNRWLKKLKDGGFVRIETTKSQGGTMRRIYLLESHPSDKKVTPVLQKSHRGVLQKSHTSITSISNTMNTIDKSIEPKRFGNEKINEVYSYWNKTCGYPLPANKENRYACNNLLKKHSVDDMKRLIDGVAMSQGDKYAPRISDMRQLQSKFTDLIVWGKKHTTSQGVTL